MHEQNTSAPQIVKAINNLLRGARSEAEANTDGQILSYNGRMMATWTSHPTLNYPKSVDIENQITETKYPDIPVTDPKSVARILRSGPKHYVYLKSEADITEYLKHVATVANSSFEFYVIHKNAPYLVSVDPTS